MTLCVIGRVKFERNCGKIYSRHLFTYGGLISTQIGRWSSLLVERVRAKKKGDWGEQVPSPQYPLFRSFSFLPALQ